MKNITQETTKMPTATHEIKTYTYIQSVNNQTSSNYADKLKRRGKVTNQSKLFAQMEHGIKAVYEITKYIFKRKGNK